MSVRKVYDVLVDGDVIFSGSYKSAIFVYDAVIKAFDVYKLSLSDYSVVPDYSIVIAFKPS